MAHANIYNPQGQKIGEISLSDKVFGVKPDVGFLHEVVVGLRAIARHAIASTKTRGDVRGGGKKPWQQKGTGRARQGSIRAPQWVGGGITFGPRSDRHFAVKINKKAKRKALFMALSDKAAQENIIAVENISSSPAKTKTVASLLKQLPIKKTALIVSLPNTPDLVRMARNIPRVKVATTQSVNVLDVLRFGSIIFLKDAVPAFEKMYG